MSADAEDKPVVNDPDIQKFANADFRTPKSRVPRDLWRKPRSYVLATVGTQRARNNLKYSELTGDQIRLLRILPRQFPRTADADESKDQIRCELAIFSLSKVQGKYEALSYRWGDENFDKRILLRTVYGTPSQGRRATSHLGSIPEHGTGTNIPRRDPHQERPTDPQYQPGDLGGSNFQFSSTHKDSQAALGDTDFEVSPYFQFPIHQNLFDAMWHLRLEKEPMFFWIDAICINQNDTEEARREKYNQFSMMGHIYNSAHNVCIWLGAKDGLDHFYAGFRFVESIMDLEQLDIYLEDKSDETKEKWCSLIHVLKAAWFSRRWIIQEVALARRASVHFGYLCTDWAHLNNAIALLIEKADSLQERFPRCRPITLIPHLSAVTLGKALQNVCRKFDAGSNVENILDLETLVCTFQQFQALRPEDIIHSVSALARDRPIHDTDDELKFDPNASTRDLFIKFVCRCIKHSKSLDIICRHWAPQSKNSAGEIVELPSWISILDRSPYGAPGGSGDLQNGENFVAKSADDDRPRYNASRGISVFFGESANAASLDTAVVSLVNEQQVVDELRIFDQPFDYPVSQNSVFAVGPVSEPVSPTDTQAPQPANDQDTVSPTTVPTVKLPKTSIGGEAHKLVTDAGVPNGEKPKNEPVLDQDFQGPSMHDQDETIPPKPPPENSVPQSRVGTGASSQLLSPTQANGRQRKWSISHVPGAKNQPREFAPERRQDAKRNQLKPFNPNDRENNRLVDRLLKVSGVRIGTIKELSEPMRRGVVPGIWLAKLGWKPTSPYPPETVWRTLVADRTPGGGNPLAWYSLACTYCLNDPRITDDEGDLHATIEDEAPEQVLKYLRRVKSVIWKRRVIEITPSPFMTSESRSTNPLYGLGPQETKPDDVVCILFGCSVPVVLRHTNTLEVLLDPPELPQPPNENGPIRNTRLDPQTAHQNIYKVVGEAFIHGKMNGEWVRDQEKSKQAAETFVLE